MQTFVIALLRAYRYLLSPVLGSNCRFYPSCSCYAIGAIKEHGLVHGCWLALRRVALCHPWHPGGFDPVPAAEPRLRHRHG